MKRAALLLTILLLILSVAVLVQADFGTNWTGDFYNNGSFSGDPDRTITNISGLNFNWPDKPNINGTISEIDADDFSVRFTSSQSFAADTYRFDIAVDDNIRVFIDGEQVFEDFTGGPVKVLSFNRTMTAGAHTLRVDFVEVSGSAVLQFQWFQGGGGIAGTVVPTASPIPPLTANVSSSVRGLAVRTGPYLGASMVTVAIPGESYPVFARNPSEEGVTWYQISVNGHTGWSSGRYLGFSVEGAGAGLGVAGSVFDNLGNPPNTGVIAVPRSIMNLRAQPSERTPIIGTVVWGEEVELLNRTVQGNRDFWYQVRKDDKVGWIYAPFVGVRGDINAVPIV